jgi:hypothetical protein
MFDITKHAYSPMNVYKVRFNDASIYCCDENTYYQYCARSVKELMEYFTEINEDKNILEIVFLCDVDYTVKKK